MSDARGPVEDADSGPNVLLGQIDAYLAGRADVEAAVVYGSLLTDRFAAHSDVDLAVAGDHAFTYDELLDMSLELGRCTGREVQVRDLRRLHGLILREVLGGGRIVKRADDGFLGAKIAEMLDFVEDWLPTMRMISQARVGRFAEGD